MDRRFCCFCFSKYPLAVGIEGRRCLEMSSGVSPGQVRKLPFLIAAMKEDLVGQPAAAWR